MKKYDSYKDSGIEWLGVIPEHWKTTKVKFEILPKGYKAGPFGSSLITSELLLSGTVKVFSPEHVAEKVIQEEWFLPEERLDEMSQFIVIDKDVVLPIVGTLGLARVFNVSIDGKGIINQRLAKISCNSKKILPDFFCVIMKDASNYQEYFKLRARGSILSHLNKETIVSMPIGLPPLEEQELILNYLKHKTTQIDTLIAKKEQFISLIQEERTAVINQAVTKGLDPKVKMKDSGIEWLGEIPEHWEVKQVRYLLEEGKDGIKIGPFGSSLKLDFMTDKGYKVYGQENVIKNDFTKGTKYIDESKYKEMVNYTISSGDIVITMMGTAGLAKVVPNDFEPGIMDSHLTRIRVNKSKFSNRLFELLINDSYLIKSQVQFHSKGSIMGGLNSSIIKSFILPTPDIDEQVKILAFIEKSILYNQEIMNQTKKEIELLKEYKTALISEVVTGKVDVREVVLN